MIQFHIFTPAFSSVTKGSYKIHVSFSFPELINRGLVFQELLVNNFYNKGHIIGKVFIIHYIYFI